MATTPAYKKRDVTCMVCHIGGKRWTKINKVGRPRWALENQDGSLHHIIVDDRIVGCENSVRPVVEVTLGGVYFSDELDLA